MDLGSRTCSCLLLSPRMQEMSTPEERMRALRWGWELLRDIQQDAAVPVESRDSARALALRHPAPVMLQALLAPPAQGTFPRTLVPPSMTRAPCSRSCKFVAKAPPILCASSCTRCATFLFTTPWHASTIASVACRIGCSLKTSPPAQSELSPSRTGCHRFG